MARTKQRAATSDSVETTKKNRPRGNEGLVVASASSKALSQEEDADVVSKAKDVDADRDDSSRDLRIILKRQWDILRRLATSSEGLTLEEMAKEFQVSEKTIKRDLKSIEYVFGELKSKNEAHGRKRYTYDRSPFSFSLTLDRDELLALYIGQTLMTPMRGTYFWKGLQSSYEKIRNILRKDVVEYAERVAPFFYRFDTAESQYSERLCNLIDQALISITDCCALRIKYRSLAARRSKTYDIYPYNFIYWSGSIYLVGYCCRDDKIKIWKADRLYAAESLPKRKFSRANFDVKKYLSHTVAPYVGDTPIRRVTMRFTGYASRSIQEEKSHLVRKCKYEPDGSVVAELEVETGKSFIRWVLGYGRHAEILSPPELRREFLVELDATRRFYADVDKNPDDVAEKSQLGGVGEESRKEALLERTEAKTRMKERSRGSRKKDDVP